MPPGKQAGKVKLHFKHSRVYANLEPTHALIEFIFKLNLYAPTGKKYGAIIYF